MKKTIIFSLLFLAAAMSGPLAAQDRRGSVEISPFGGLYLGGTLYAGSNAVFSRDVSVATSASYGLRLTGYFNQWAGLEGSFSRAVADIENKDVLFGPQQKLGELDSMNFELNGIFNFTKGRVVPYATVGLGATILKAKVGGYDSSSDTRFTPSFGLGLKTYFNPQFGLRIEGKWRAAYLGEGSDCDHHYPYCDDDYWDSYDDSDWYHSGDITAGLVFAF